MPVGDWLPGVADGAGGPAVSGEAGTHDEPPTFEQLGHLGPLVRYDAPLPADAFNGADAGALVVAEARDLIWVMVDGRPVGRLSRALHERALSIPRGARLTLLVEDQGRVNYDHRLGEPKGPIAPVTLNGRPLRGWSAEPVDLAEVAARVSGSPSGPAVGRVALHGEFTLDEASDLFLDTSAWGKEFAFVNGFFLGRYWVSGPQQTLYVPAPVTRAGRNEVVILELEQLADASASFVAHPALGHHED